MPFDSSTRRSAPLARSLLATTAACKRSRAHRLTHVLAKALARTERSVCCRHRRTAAAVRLQFSVAVAVVHCCLNAADCCAAEFQRLTDWCVSKHVTPCCTCFRRWWCRCCAVDHWRHILTATLVSFRRRTAAYICSVCCSLATWCARMRQRCSSACIALRCCIRPAAASARSR